MAKEAVFTMKLEPELRDAFMAAAAAADRPASQIVRELMKDYLRDLEEEKHGYEEYLRRKVERSLKSIEAGHVHSQAEIDADVAARREKFSRLANEAGK